MINHTKIFRIFASIIVIATLQWSRCHAVVPYLSLRSQTVHAERLLAGNHTRPYMVSDCLYGALSIIPTYSRSFDNQAIARALLGELLEGTSCQSHGCIGFSVQGTTALQKKYNSWLAEYAYLPTDYNGYVSINPCIDMFLIDFDWYAGAPRDCHGLYGELRIPGVFTRYHLGYAECSTNRGSAPYDPGYFNDSYEITDTGAVIGLPRSQMVSTFTDFIFHKESIDDVERTNYEPLRYARMSPFRIANSHTSDLQASLGWNFVTNNAVYASIALRVVAPTGTRPHGEFLFEPVIGNGHHWELGARLLTDWYCWQSLTHDHALSTHLDIAITHMFSAMQCRTFDLKGIPLSRYMLASHMQKLVNNLQVATDYGVVVPTGQFQGIFSPVANISTITTSVSIPVHLDAAWKLSYASGPVQCDIGYDLWYRSYEHIKPCCSCLCQQNLNGSWCLKGDAFMYGFQETSQGTPAQPGIPLSALQSHATLFHGTNNWPGSDEYSWNQNPGINDPKGFTQPTLVTHNGEHPTTFWLPVFTSIDPQGITLDELDIDGASTRGLSNLLFVHISYTPHYCPCTRMLPSIGIGGEVEFGDEYALSQYSFWIKGTIIF